MRRRALGWIAALAAVGARGAVAQDLPLDVSDPTSRTVTVRFETSSDPAVVGQSFGAAWPAAWSVAGGIGRVEMSAETHGEARAAGEGLGYEPVPGSFSPIVIEIDLATLEATSDPTAGALTNDPLSFSFATRALDSTATGGFVGPDFGNLYCTSQQQVDDLCAIVPSACGKTCTIVPGEPFDPVDGTIHLVGSEAQQGCDGGLCQGPFEVFAKTGDLLLAELPAAPVPAASQPLRAVIALFVVSVGALALRRRRS